MLKLHHGAIALIAFATLSGPALGQARGAGEGAAPAPGTGNGAALANGLREENAAYNRVIGKVGADPVGKEKAKAAAKVRAVAATAADIVPGAAVRDAKGIALGRIESIDGDSAILVFATGKIRYPLVGFGKDPQGLLISLTTSDFLALVAKATAGS